MVQPIPSINGAVETSSFEFAGKVLGFTEITVESRTETETVFRFTYKGKRHEGKIEADGSVKHVKRL